MIGFRLLAIILGLLCLASAGVLVMHQCPQLAEANTFFIKNFIPDAAVQQFLKSKAPDAVAVKNIVKYIFSGYAVLALGMGLLFFCAAANPLRMRPFIVVVMIGAILWIAAAIYQGLTLEIYKTWWISDAAGALILLVLLTALFPKKKPAEPAAPEMGEE